MTDLQNAFAKIQKAITQTIYIDSTTINSESEQNKIFQLVDLVLQQEPNEIRNRIKEELFGIGPLVALLENSQITEIICTESKSIFFEQKGKLNLFHDCFLSDLTYTNFLHRISKETLMSFSIDKPFVNFHWRGFRGHLTVNPISQGAPILHLRAQPQSPWTIDQLQNHRWCDHQQRNILTNIVLKKMNVFVVGATGSGKTSALSALMQMVEQNERVVIIEDTDELKLPNLASSKLLTRVDALNLLTPITQSELVKQALRMRPDRLIMGEARGEEAKDLLLALATGHRGSMGTLHADSPQQALMRLEMLVQMGAPQWSLQTIKKLISLSIDIVLVVGKDQDGQRKLKSIHQVIGNENDSFLLQDLSLFPMVEK